LDIDGWLRGIGLAQYAEMFRANDIDIELLGRLTNDDLKDIGVASFGHRKKLLEGIAALAAAPKAPSPIPVATMEPKTQDSGERRQVTVMFSDLVGSTAMSVRMDPEDLREVISVRAWAALRPSSVASRFEALRASGMTALVGREEETELLLGCWSKTKAGEGQVVSLSGEAGIGKSRLTAFLLERLATEPHARPDGARGGTGAQ
jgi:hypothetical protein